MHTVQQALDEDLEWRADRLALGTGVPLKVRHWLALLHSSAGRRPVLAGNGLRNADRNPVSCPLFTPESLQMALIRAWLALRSGGMVTQA